MIAEMKELYDNRVQLAEDWKRSGGKVLGYFNALTPEELIFAAGLLPVQVLSSKRKISQAGSVLPEFLCTNPKDWLEQALAGELDYLDGVAMSHVCEALRGFYGVWKRNANMPRSFFLQIPSSSGEEAKKYFLQELTLLKIFLEEISGQEVTNDRLLHAIEVYNNHRTLMRQLYDLRQRPGSSISGRDIINTIKAGLVIPKNLHNDKLTQLIRHYGGSEQVQPENGALKLYISGITLDETETIIETIEALGGQVVSDDFCFGLRYCWEHVKVDGDPLESLAEHYLKKIPFPGKYSMGLMADQVTEMVSTSQADGMIWVVEKYCDPYLFHAPILLRKVEEKGIKMLSLEAEEAGNPSRLRMKIEAFMESLQEDLL
ncbi:2-hydroxyacyl-CoA dehydratase subunit D [Thermodesulfobacteriota bacterium]